MTIKLESDQLRINSHVILSTTLLKLPEYFFVEILIYQTDQYFD
jgi:hypothetical protein